MPEKKYWPAPEVEEIGNTLVRIYHRHLTRVPLVYSFRQEGFPSRGGQIIYAKIRKLTGLAAYFANSARGIVGFDYTLSVEFVWSLWESLGETGNFGLVDHELSHTSLDPKGNIVLIPHFNEEFPAVIARWGFYLGGRREYAETCARILQEERNGLRPNGVLIGDQSSVTLSACENVSGVRGVETIRGLQ